MTSVAVSALIQQTVVSVKNHSVDAMRWNDNNESCNWLTCNMTLRKSTRQWAINDSSCLTELLPHRSLRVDLIHTAAVLSCRCVEHSSSEYLSDNNIGLLLERSRTLSCWPLGWFVKFTLHQFTQLYQ